MYGCVLSFFALVCPSSAGRGFLKSQVLNPKWQFPKIGGTQYGHQNILILITGKKVPLILRNYENPRLQTWKNTP